MSSINENFLKTVARSFVSVFKQHCTVRYDPTSKTMFVEHLQNKSMLPSRISYLLAKDNKVLALLIEKNEITLKVVQPRLLAGADMSNWQSVEMEPQDLM